MIPNDDMPRQPDEDEPLEHEAGDVLDFIDETVAQITDADVDEHLRRVLDRAGYSHDQHTDPSLWFNSITEFQVGSNQAKVADLIAAAIRMQVEPWCGQIRQAQQEIEDARREADHILAEAREEADEALSQAAKMVRDAREQAERIISEASSQADRILKDADLQRSQTLSDAGKNILGAVFMQENQSQVLPRALRMVCSAGPTAPLLSWASIGAGTFQRFADHVGINVAPTQQPRQPTVQAGFAKLGRLELTMQTDELFMQTRDVEETPPTWGVAYILVPADHAQEQPADHAEEQPTDHKVLRVTLQQSDGAEGHESAIEPPSTDLLGFWVKGGKTHDMPDTKIDEDCALATTTVTFHLEGRELICGPRLAELTQSDDAQSTPVGYGLPQIPPVPR